MMELKSKEIIERFKEKIPLIKNVDHRMYGITQLDIICEDCDTIKQYVLAFERLKFIEPTEFINMIYADVYVRIKDETLYKIAMKEISINDALRSRLFVVYGDREIWQMQVRALRSILPNEEFNNVEKIEDSVTREEIDNNLRANRRRESDEEWHRRADLSTIPPQLKFLADALEELHKRL